MPPRERRPGRVAVPVVIGALAGLSLTSSWGATTMLLGAMTGGLLLAVTEIVARARQRPNEIPALWARIVMSVALAAIFGALLGLSGAGPLVVGPIFGTVAGVLGVGPRRSCSGRSLAWRSAGCSVLCGRM